MFKEKIEDEIIYRKITNIPYKNLNETSVRYLKESIIDKSKLGGMYESVNYDNLSIKLCEFYLRTIKIPIIGKIVMRINKNL